VACGGQVAMASAAIACSGEVGLQLLLLDEAIENDAQIGGAGDGALLTVVIDPLELALGNHKGDGPDGMEHEKEPMAADRT
jgi:hypothetical protein